LLLGGSKSNGGPLSLLFRDGVEEGGCGKGPLDNAIKKTNVEFVYFYIKNFLRVPVLLSDRSESPCSVFCGFIADDESKSVDNGSASSSSFRLFVLLFVCNDCLEENISEN
jgi:hypothetical protein